MRREDLVAEPIAMCLFSPTLVQHRPGTRRATPPHLRRGAVSALWKKGETTEGSPPDLGGAERSEGGWLLEARLRRRKRQLRGRTPKAFGSADVPRASCPCPSMARTCPDALDRDGHGTMAGSAPPAEKATASRSHSKSLRLGRCATGILPVPEHGQDLSRCLRSGWPWHNGRKRASGGESGSFAVALQKPSARPMCHGHPARARAWPGPAPMP